MGSAALVHGTGNHIRMHGEFNMTQPLSWEDLDRRTIQRRGVEAVIWGMPSVNFDRMYQAMVHDAKAGEGSNKVVY